MNLNLGFIFSISKFNIQFVQGTSSIISVELHIHPYLPMLLVAPANNMTLDTKLLLAASTGCSKIFLFLPYNCKFCSPQMSRNHKYLVITNTYDTKNKIKTIEAGTVKDNTYWSFYTLVISHYPI